ncbi:dynein regulatory complex subunit 3-like isoform X6 [Hyperolius riggenbachi]|uniref:dynein regulatory complex subunit 3-like isoform X6 n=1 Tax=Hyperolius riggenbachi TaxID=752182 RepID=UPI0035A3981E
MMEEAAANSEGGSASEFKHFIHFMPLKAFAMDHIIKRQFVEDRSTTLESLPVSWNVKESGPYYCVTMKMCHIHNLVFDFEFGSLESSKKFSVTAFPEKILKMDLSLNDLNTLEENSFQHFQNLMELNVSFNFLNSVPGLRVLPNLIVGDLSYNAINEMEEFTTCTQLSTLNVSHNTIRSIKSLPTLAHLTKLHLNSNKGNPLALDNRYTSLIKRQTSVSILDNTLLRNATDIELSPVYHSLLRESLDTLSGKEYTREKLHEAVRNKVMFKLKIKQDAVESSIHLLHEKAMELQEELKGFEEDLRGELENCIRYIDAIPQEDFFTIDPHKVERATEQYLFTKFWEKWAYGQRKPGNLHLTDSRNSEEVVKAAAWLLSQPPHNAPGNGS